MKKFIHGITNLFVEFEDVEDEEEEFEEDATEVIEVDKEILPFFEETKKQEEKPVEIPSVPVEKEEFAIPTVKEKTKSTTNTVKPMPKPVVKPTKARPSYEFIQVISPIHGVANTEQTSTMEVKAPEKKTLQQVTPATQTILSPTNGFFTDRELNGVEVEEEIKNMKVEDFLGEEPAEKPLPSRVSLRKEQNMNNEDAITNLSLFDDEDFK